MKLISCTHGGDERDLTGICQACDGKLGGDRIYGIDDVINRSWETVSRRRSFITGGL